MNLDRRFGRHHGVHGPAGFRVPRLVTLATDGAGTGGTKRLSPRRGERAKLDSLSHAASHSSS